MPIQPLQPITIPAKTADVLWVSYMSVNAPSAQAPVTAFIRLAPFVSATGEVINDQAQTIEIPDLFAAAAVDPVLGNALNTLFAAIQKLAHDRNMFVPPAPEAPVEPDTQPSA